MSGRRKPAKRDVNTVHLLPSIALVKSLCDALDAEPLFHMSLGSKELFHSNFLGWLAERHPEATGQALEPWTRPSKIGHGSKPVAEREASRLDLILRLPGLAPIVFENKVFSVPDEQQLIRYAERGLDASQLKAPVRILLSMTNPLWPSNEYEGWRWRSYDDLVSRLQGVVARIDSAAPFDASLLEHYIHFVSLLTELLKTVGEAAGEYMLPADMLDVLHRVRLSAGVEKARASHAAHLIREAVSPDRKDVRIGPDFSRGTAMIDCFVATNRVPPGGDEPDQLGWQLQGHQFRLAVITKIPERAVRERYVAEHYESWFDFAPYHRVTGLSVDQTEPPAPRLRKDRIFHGYDPSFVHRYRICPQVTVDSLVALGKAYVDLATARR